jgi:hypothetical protein
MLTLTVQRYYDVPTFFGRDISRFKDFANLWYGGSDKLIKSANPSIVCLSSQYAEEEEGEKKQRNLFADTFLSLELDKDSVSD